MLWNNATPDAVASAYFAALEAVDAIPAQRLSVSIEVCGRTVAVIRLANGQKQAVLCAGPPTTRIGRVHTLEDEWLGARAVREEVVVCAKCGQVWQPAERELGLMRGEVCIRGSVGWDQGGGRVVRASLPARAGVAEEGLIVRLDRLRPLRKLIEPKPRDLSSGRWLSIRRLWKMYLLPGVGTYAEVARLAQEATSTSEPTPAKVEGEISLARVIVRDRMERGGSMNTWSRDELEAEIRRLEARAAHMGRLDRIAVDRTLARLRKWLRRATQRAA